MSIAYPPDTGQSGLEEETRHLLANDPDELIRRIMLIYSAYEDERVARDLAEKDSQQVREENGELLEELTAERQAHEQTRQMYAMECRRNEDLDEKYRSLHNREKWRNKLLANETIPNANCKLVADYLWKHGLEDTDREIQFFKEHIAANLACDPGTVSNAIERMKSFNVINVRTEPIILPDGTKHKDALTFISRNTLVDPTQIVMEKKQGAAKPKVCFRDGTPMNAYTVRHCPVHGEIGLYDQPCTPKGTDETLMIDDFIRKYRNYVPRALSSYRDPVTGELISQEQDLCNQRKPLSPASTEAPSSVLSTTPLVGSAAMPLMTTPLPHSPSMESTIRPEQQDTGDKLTPVMAGKKSHPTNTSNNKTSNSEEKKPSSTALAPSNEDDRWAAAEKILTELNEYGLALIYEGGRRLVETSTIKPSNAQIKNLAEQIKLYETEIRTYLSMQADYDPQEAILLNTSLPEDQQITLEHPHLSTQRIPPPSTESFFEGDSHD